MERRDIVDALIEPQLVAFDIPANTKEDAIRALAERMSAAGRITDLDGYITDVIAREDSSSTAVGFLVATPHAKSGHVAVPSLGFARLAGELAWDEDENVRLVFLIAVPVADAGDRHLRILAKLFRKLVDESFISTISEATDPDDIVALVADID